MILVLCQPCALGFRIMGGADEVDALVGECSDFWPDKFPCPRCEKDCMGVSELAADPRALRAFELVELTPQEAFAAFNGLGLPSEGQCTVEEITRLLREQPIRHLGAVNLPGTTRCRINFLELWDGTRLHFGAGAEGAVLYRRVLPRTAVEKFDAR